MTSHVPQGYPLWAIVLSPREENPVPGVASDGRSSELQHIDEIKAATATLADRARRVVAWWIDVTVNPIPVLAAVPGQGQPQTHLDHVILAEEPSLAALLALDELRGRSSAVAP